MKRIRKIVGDLVAVALVQASLGGWKMGGAVGIAESASLGFLQRVMGLARTAEAEAG